MTLRENPDFDPTLKHDCLMFLDEFPSIGYMPIIKKGSGYIAGFKLKLLTIYQNISQLNEIYGIEGAKTLMSAHPCRIIYAVSEEDDAAKISENLDILPLHQRAQARAVDGQHHRANQKVKPEEHWCFHRSWERWTLKKSLSS